MRPSIRESRKDEPTTRTEDRTPQQIIGRLLEGASESVAVSNQVNGEPQAGSSRPPVALFCHEPAESFIGGHVRHLAAALAERGRHVHVFCPTALDVDHPQVRCHAVGQAEEGDLIEQVQDFTRGAGNAFFQTFPAGAAVEVVAYEWTSAPVLSLLRGLRNQPGLLALHSLEQQRSDLSSDLSRRIVEIEVEGLKTAATTLIHEPSTTELAWQLVPTANLVDSRGMFPLHRFESALDAGAVKARYQIGPVDPTIVCVGDLEERYGPDLLLKAMPAILRHHPQARLVLVGDGSLYWPLKVFTRYLLLEHAVRLVGHLQDQELDELFTAADLIVVPSRESTPWWPIQAGWAARKPVVATHEAARSLTEHEKDSVLVYPSENSIVWGVERVLYDPGLAQALREAGRAKLEERFGWSTLAEQLEELLEASLPR